MKETTLQGHLYANASKFNPLQTSLTFVFTDFKPNANSIGVPQTEASNIIRTGLYQPVKINYQNKEIAGHEGSIPVGPITELFEENGQIIGKAVLWNEEFEELSGYLKAQSQAEAHIGFSWEIFYENSTEIDGVNWLQNCVVKAATIVDTPAYGLRTPLLEIAEELRMNEKELKEKIEALSTQLAELQDKLNSTTTEMTSVVAERDQLKETLSQIDIDQLREELETLRAFRTQVEAEKTFNETKESRTKILTEAGIEFSDEELGTSEAPGEFMVMSEEVFNAAIAMAKRTAKPKETVEDTKEEKAEARGVVPDINIGTESKTDISDIVNALKNYK